jgi:hypothetical protein
VGGPGNRGAEFGGFLLLVYSSGLVIFMDAIVNGI